MVKPSIGEIDGCYGGLSFEVVVRGWRLDAFDLPDDRNGG